MTTQTLASGSTGMAFDGRDAPEPNRSLTIALLALLLGAIVGVFSSDYFASAYAGIGAFLMIPAAVGGLFSQLSDPAGRWKLMGCFFWPTISLLMLALVAWLFFGEGAICIAMVLPLWVPAAIVGALVTRYNARRDRQANDPSRLNGVGWLALPILLITSEAFAPPDWQTVSVVREVAIDANHDEIWPLLLNVRNISSHEGLGNFTHDVLGVPRPTDADLVRRDGKLIRIAHWGRDLRFEEIITDRKAGELLQWTFAFPDKSVQLHTDRHISPNGPLLKIETGRYDLAAVGEGRSKLRLTTTFQMRTRFAGYLGWWGETLLGDVQDNVLEVIKARAEGRAAGS